MILDDIVEKRKEQLQREKDNIEPQDMKEMALNSKNKNHGFKEALKKSGLSVISEVKKASPSKGLIAPDFPYLAIAKECEQAGASAICVHGRTRTDRYLGHSDWNIIKEVKESVNIPVIGNGDIKTVYDAKRMIDETGCDAVMIGRSALGNPWIILDTVNYLTYGILPKEITKQEKIDMCIKHLNYLLEFKPEKVAVLEMRSHIAWYLKGVEGAREIKNELFKAQTKDEIINILNEFSKE